MIGWLIFGSLLLYFLYTRLWKFYSTLFFYKNQGIPFHQGIVPIFGSQFQIMKFINSKDKTKGHPLNEFLEATYFTGKKEVPAIVGLSLGTSI